MQENKVSLSSYSPLTLAFIGDTIFDLLVREELVREGNRPVNQLHKTASTMVCASAQAESIRKVMDSLTEEELDVFKRGRNAHPGSTRKNQSVADYHYATGLESLFGWLYLGGKTERIKELYSLMKEDKNEENREEK